jgi:hypothetical protein
VTRTPKLLATMLVALILLYAGTYYVLSLNGRYEPAVWGPDGPKWYSWAPAGFVQDLMWNEPLILTFYPLWRLDIRYWHTCDDAYSGRYPINDLG